MAESSKKHKDLIDIRYGSLARSLYEGLVAFLMCVLHIARLSMPGLFSLRVVVQPPRQTRVTCQPHSARGWVQGVMIDRAQRILPKGGLQRIM